MPKDLRKDYETEVADIEKKLQSKEEIKCFQCVSEGRSVSFCNTCHLFLCETCSNHHKIWRETHNHDLGPVVKSEPPINVPHKPIKCCSHKDELLKLYCEKCKLLICRDCIIDEHKDHKHSLLDKVAEKEREDLLSKFKKTRTDDVKSKLDNAIAQGERMIQQVQAKQRSVEEAVESAFELFSETLQRHKRDLLNRTSEIGKGKVTALELQKEELKTLRNEVTHTCEMITAATEDYTPAEMLLVKETMATRLQQVSKDFREANLEPCRSDVMPYILETSEVVEKITSFGVVVGGSCPAEAKAHLHLPRAVVGKPKTVTIVTHDAQGKQYKHGGERVEVSLSLDGSNDPPPYEAVIQDKDDGRYIATITPYACGKHRMSITVETQRMKGNPLELHVRQPRNYKRMADEKRICEAGNPYAVSVDDSGKVYIADYNQDCISVFDQNGRKLRAIGSTGINDGQFDFPSGVAIRGTTLYVTEIGNHRVQMLTTDGCFISKFGTQGDGRGQFNRPSGICLDFDGRIFVSDNGNDRISVFAPDGTFAYHISSYKLRSPWGIALDPSGNLHVANNSSKSITIFSLNGKYIAEYPSQVDNPTGIAIDEEGYSIIAGYYNAGDIWGTVYGYFSILDSNHQLVKTIRRNLPRARGTTIDKDGIIYVCYSGTNHVYKYTAELYKPN